MTESSTPDQTGFLASITLLALAGASMLAGGYAWLSGGGAEGGVQWAQIFCAVSAGLAFFGITLKMRNEILSRPRVALTGGHHRIPAYEPAMATGADGFTALRRVISPLRPEAPAPQAAQQPAPGFAPIRRARQDGPRLGLRRTSHRAASGAGSALFAAARLGQGWAEELKLSPRAMAQVDADPFVQRLGRLT